MRGEITRHHRTGRHRDHPRETHLSATGQRPRGQQQGERGHEGTDQQNRPGQDGNRHDEVDGRRGHTADDREDAGHRPARATAPSTTRTGPGTPGRSSRHTLAGGRLAHTVRQPVAYRRR